MSNILEIIFHERKLIGYIIRNNNLNHSHLVKISKGILYYGFIS